MQNSRRARSGFPPTWGEPSSSREIDLVGRRYGLHTGGEGKGTADEITILNGNVTKCDDDTYRDAVVTTIWLCQAQLLLHLDRRLGRAGDAGKFQPMAVARGFDNVALVFGGMARHEVSMLAEKRLQIR